MRHIGVRFLLQLKGVINDEAYVHPILIIYIIKLIKLQEQMIEREVLEENNQAGVEEHYGEIIDLKKNQMKIKLVLELPETEEEEKQQLMELKANIQQALKAQIETVRNKEKQLSLYPLSIELLTMADLNKLAKVFNAQQRKWKNGKVLSVDVQEQTAEVKVYGLENPATYPAYYLKVLKEPDEQLFKEGTHCKAIYSQDGEFYPCIIEKIDEEGYHVRYKKYDSKEVVQLHRLRPMQTTNNKTQQVKFQDLEQFRIPDKLKIQPNDPQHIKKQKKTKIKALKFAFNNAKIDQMNNEKKDKWKNWNNNSTKTGYFKTKYDIQAIQSKQTKK